MNASPGVQRFAGVVWFGVKLAAGSLTVLACLGVIMACVAFIAMPDGRLEAHTKFLQHGFDAGRPAFLRDLGVSDEDIAKMPPRHSSAVGAARVGLVVGLLTGWELMRKSWRWLVKIIRTRRFTGSFVRG